jgi:hypothetical protein
MRAQEFISEISDEQLQRYLDRAGRKVDARQERMARARERLNKGYEIYHADAPNKIVDRFEANTSQEAKRYYDDFITKYESDVDYDLRLRRATGIMESTNKQATAQQVLDYINRTHHDPFEPGGKMTNAVLAHPHWELVRVPLLNLNIPDQEYDDVDYDEYEPDTDPYGRVMTVEPEHAGEVSQHLIDKKPIVIDADRYIIDGNHRAWAAKYLLNRDYVMAWRPVAVNENFADGKVKGKSRPGRVKRAGASCNGSVTDLRKRAKNSSGEQAKMYHWCANMKSGRKK